MAAVHALPVMHSYHSRQSLNGVNTANAAGPSVLPTPPVASRKRKRAQQYTVSYSEVQETDSDGRVRDVIVIEDTPPPTMSPATTHGGGYSAPYQPPVFTASIRTRARAAAEAQALSASASASGVAPPPKKRKRDPADEIRALPAKKVAPGSQHSQAITQTKSWGSRSAAATDETSKGPVSCDDKEGHYIIVPDDIIFKRYRTVRLLGQGTFGKVVEAIDTFTNTRVAIKIIRAIPKYRDASRIEVRVLRELKMKDPLNTNKCIHLLDTFDHRNHVCLVSELLGMCVFDFLKDNEFAPFPRHHIQSFARQLLNSVAFLHRESLIHTDLKPENILLVHNNYRIVNIPVTGKNAAPKSKRILNSTEIRLIDFGSATFEKEYHSQVVSTRHYRAPEIILGLGWSFPCDVYSLGCILVEFYTGSALFQTHDNLEHLAMMEMVMGKMPDRFARAGARSKPEFFKEGSKLDWPKPKASRQSKKDVRATRPLDHVIPPTDQINRHFLNLVQRLLAFDPSQRITVAEALKHPYFSLIIPPEI
ncbi:CMGC/CLK protein kinase [Lentinula boryana]|uniref:CMGC/CLK protein kinase n=1 Tax=Lentinula boryana TaxID=40481 RepID=A0ABQ8QF83_9AGAR|nr:CMGC/CLK protein kinase [Lentinula boryana]